MPDYIGTSGADVLVGDKGAGLLDGRDGDDILIVASAGDFTLSGGAGDDRLFGGSYRDSLSGGSGADTLEGGVGQDTYSGGAGPDLFNWAKGQAGTDLNQPDTILDWSAEDRLSFANGEMVGLTYAEVTAANLGAARDMAQNQLRLGINFVSAQVGSDVYVFVDSAANNGQPYPYFGDFVLLKGASLASIDIANFVGIPAGPVFPAAPAPATVTGGGYVGGNLDALKLGDLIGADIVDVTPTYFGLNGDKADADVRGVNFTYDANQQLVGGSVTQFLFISDQLFVTLTRAALPAAQIANWVLTDANADALASLLSGNDWLQGESTNDLIRGFAGDDCITGGDGSNSLFGGPGNDIIYAWEGPGISGYMDVGLNYLRGDEGDDYLVGSTKFDDINGNAGADTANGGGGDDWVVGGKDNDLLFGSSGADIVYGNLGDDTVEGGDGNDVVRGGQGNDMVFGDAGADFVSGDRGDDTVGGGLGADIFHTSQDAGLDRVIDFSVSQGDRVQVDPGTTYFVAQVGADVVIDMGGANRMVLVNVPLATLPSGWIFAA